MQNINRIHSENIHKNIILELNGLRGFACLLIFLFHCRIMSGSPDIRLDLGLLYLLPLHGAYAVDLFFVLSGFFIILPYAKAGSQGKKPFSFYRYYKKKFIRIFPAYYINLAVMFGIVVPIFIGGDYLLSKSGLKMLLAHMSFLHYLHPSTSASLGINCALWTLSITFQFFLIFPFIKNLFTGGHEKNIWWFLSSCQWPGNFCLIIIQVFYSIWPWIRSNNSGLMNLPSGFFCPINCRPNWAILPSACILETATLPIKTAVKKHIHGAAS
jgi:peptidoglycan/LPS O-acetylase OafA/YrhL